MINSININNSLSVRSYNPKFCGTKNSIISTIANPSAVPIIAAATSAFILHQFDKLDSSKIDNSKPINDAGFIDSYKRTDVNLIDLDNLSSVNRFVHSVFDARISKSYFVVQKNLDEKLNGWIVVPSKEQDPNNFEANVGKLEALFRINRITTIDPRTNLEKGGIHVYIEQGKPKLEVRFNGDEIETIRGEMNDGKIPVKYRDIIKEHINDYKLTPELNIKLQQMERAHANMEKIKALSPNGINNASVRDILETLGIECTRGSDGLLTISHYGYVYYGGFDNRENYYSYSDLGIDENRLFEQIKAIKGDADFRNSQVTNLGNLESIGGDALLINSQLTSLSNLKTIGGDALFAKSQVRDLSNLESIGGDALFRNSQVAKLGNLKSIGGCAMFSDSQITSLGDLESIGKKAVFSESKVANLGKLKSIYGYALIGNSLLSKEDFKGIEVYGGIRKN